MICQMISWPPGARLHGNVASVRFKGFSEKLRRNVQRRSALVEDLVTSDSA